MASILNKLKIFLLENSINKQQTKIEFLDDFLLIKIKNLKTKSNNKIELIDLKNKHELLKYEIKAQIDSEYLKSIYQEEKAKLEKKLYWQERALKQKIKRSDNNGEELLADFSKKKSEALSSLKAKYYLESSTKEAKESYLDKKESLDKSFLNKKTEITNNLNTKIENIKESVKTNIAKRSLILKKKEDNLSKIEIKSAYELEDNIILKLDNLSMYFGGLKAVDKLNFEVKEGEIFGLIGPNGAGKTTVFNCITKFYKPTDGDMYFKNSLGEVVHLNKIAVHNIIKEGIVRTFQNVEMIWELNVLENLLVAAHSQYRSGFFGHLFKSRLLRQEEVVTRRKAEKILFDLDLQQYMYSYPFGLPYGILKKIELARTLMIKPKLIILDEPAAGLNDIETEMLAETIKKIRKDYKTTIFLVEHDMGLVMEICDTVCAISFGQKLAIGTPKEIQSSKIVREAYLGGE